MYRTILIFCSVSFVLFIGCISTFKTAKTAPPGCGNHVLSAEMIAFNFWSVEYSYRRGITKRLEVGGAMESNAMKFSLGMKYGILPFWAIDFNGKYFWADLGEFGSPHPDFDVTSIFGTDKIYGGVKYVYKYVYSTQLAWPFFGFRYPIYKGFGILGEISFTNEVKLTTLGFAFNLRTGKWKK